MIRRHVGNQFFLIAQHDHAVLAEQVARHVGNAEFDRPEPFEKTMTGIRLHDCGWPLHDDLPTLNDKGQPLDVFEPAGQITLKVWAAGADRAMEVDLYSALLVSLHVLSLSLFMAPQTIGTDPGSLALRFAVNKFQHREIERQEQLRRKLGMRTDRPLQFGIAAANAAPEEDQLAFNFRLLQVMDLVSLGLCCTRPPVEQTQDVFRRAGTHPVRMRLKRDDNDALHLHPWPFDVDEIALNVPYRAVKQEPFQSVEEFRQAYLQAKIEQLPLRLQNGWV